MTKRIKLPPGIDGLAIILFVIVVILAYRDFGNLRGIVISPWIEFKETSGEVITSIEILKSSGKSQTREFAEVIYRYSVKDRIYESNQVNFAGDGYRVDYYLKKYPQGNNVTVFYSETFPSISTLEPEKISIGSIRGLLITAVLLILYPKFLNPILSKLEQKLKGMRPRD